MNKKLYTALLYLCLGFLLNFFPKFSEGQNCNTLTATYVSTESRCASTGSIQINASGGSGNYMYRVLGPLATNFSTNSLITGLPAGKYLAVIKDINTNCIYQHDSVTVAGNYKDPGFLMSETDVTCMNGSDGTITVTSEQNGRSPFMYTIVAPSASNIGVQSATGIFTGLLYGSYMIQLTDSCGGIQNRSMTIANYSWLINSYSVSRICDSATILINLKDSKGNTTPNAIFNLFTYGVVRAIGDTAWYSTSTFKFFISTKRNLTLIAKDKCGNVQSVSWVDNNKPSVNASVSISNKACSTFTVTVTGVVNFINPQFCLFDNNNIQLSCNSTGIFNNITYGTYCIKITDLCYDTTISRCFTVTKPVPSVNVNIANKTCTGFNLSIIGSNLMNPYFCLYDNNNVLLYCDSTGIFNNLTYGTYCIHITNNPACYDTTIIKCFTVTKPVPSINNNVGISNLTCTTFTATIQDTTGWNSPQFCLYTSAHVLIVCNSTGVFNNLAYGTYCIDVKNNPLCYDTTIERCFTVNRPVPSVGANVNVSNKTCTTFTATIQNQQNLNSPNYCLFDVNNVQIVCNTTGIFTNLAYGTYCIKVTNSATCYDTVITRCFTATPPQLQMTLSAAKSCTLYGGTDITINISSGTPTYYFYIYDPTNLQVANGSSSSGNITVNGLPNLISPQQYKVIVTDQCNNNDTLLVTPVASSLTKSYTLTNKCPSGINPNGSADLSITTTTNMGSVTPKIIKKNGAAVSITYNYNLWSLFIFYDLPPATYIVQYSTSGCTTKLYDTIVVTPYVYPDLLKSTAYVCDNNTVSIGAVATGGIAPFQYQIFQCVPATPSIVTPLQSSPIFTFSGTTNYTLIRLRAIDACGNATLNDVSILPLAPITISTSGLYCLNGPVTLSVDTITYATYKWYHKISPIDSVLVSSTYSYFIPVLHPADTGIYVCVVSVNNNCLVRTAYYDLGGNCGTILPVDAMLKGYLDENKKSNLSWDDLNGVDVKQYQIERASDNNNNFQLIGMKEFTGLGSTYYYVDDHPLVGNNYYRLKVIETLGVIRYSNVVNIKNNGNGNTDINVYPNPVLNELNIQVTGNNAGNYSIDLITSEGQKIYSGKFTLAQNETVKILRNNNMAKGFYMVVVTNFKTGKKIIRSVMYQ